MGHQGGSVGEQVPTCLWCRLMSYPWTFPMCLPPTLPTILFLFPVHYLIKEKGQKIYKMCKFPVYKYEVFILKPFGLFSALPAVLKMIFYLHLVTEIKNSTLAELEIAFDTYEAEFSRKQEVSRD